MLEKIKQLDIELLIYLNNLGSETWDGFWMFMTTSVTSIPVYVVVLYFLYKSYGIKKAAFALIFVALLITLSDQTSNLFKYGFERLRPCHEEGVQNLIRLVKPGCGGKYSFFSAHASTSMAIAFYCSLLLRKRVKYLPTFLIVWALFVGYSRIYIGVHYPFDVLVGFCVGIFYATFVYMLYRLFSKRFLSE